MINRGSVIVRPKQPYIDWAAGLEDAPILPEYEGEKTVYLIPEYDDDDHAMEILSEGFDLIFESELYGWYTDEAAWPKHRTFAMFKEWFHIELNSVVSDLCEYEIEDDGYV